MTFRNTLAAVFVVATLGIGASIAEAGSRNRGAYRNQYRNYYNTSPFGSRYSPAQVRGSNRYNNNLYGGNAYTNPYRSRAGSQSLYGNRGYSPYQSNYRYGSGGVYGNRSGFYYQAPRYFR